MKTAVLTFACVLALAACNKSPEIHETNASVAEVASKVREASAQESFVQPGKWQSKVTIDEMQIPGMPAEMAQRMKQQMAQYQAHSFETCLTKAEVKKPKEDFFTGKDDQCRYDHFTMAGGKIDAVMRCDRGNEGGSQIMELAGTYAPETYAMKMSMIHEGGAGHDAGMTMKMHVDARRIGDCTKAEEAEEDREVRSASGTNG